MTLTLDVIKTTLDKDYTYGDTTRGKAANDSLFYHITHWDSELADFSTLSYRGEFDVLKKAGRGIMSDLAALPVQPDFEPEEGTDEDQADLMDGLYRAGASKNRSQEAFITAQQEAVVCGFGAWELYTRYKTNRIGDKRQVVERRPINEANNVIIWDANAKLIDKSDAKHVSYLKSFSEEGYFDLVEEMTGDRPDVVPPNLKTPEQSYAFPWSGGEGQHVYVVEHYKREKIKDKALTFEDPFGETMILSEKDLIDDGVMDDLIDNGYEIVDEKETCRYIVTKYIVSGEEILNGKIDPKTEERSGEVIAGPHLPIVPYYGERCYVDGEEIYEGITRCAKDPQRLRDFVMSYIADIASKSPRPMPIFLQEQFAGLEEYFEEGNPYPYAVQNKVDGAGNDLPLGPVGMMPESPIPTSLMALVELTRQAVDDVAQAGLPGEIADVDLSGKAVLALQNKIESQSSIYQEHGKFAKRRDAEVFAGMAMEILDTPRKERVELPDGTKKDVEIMQSVVDAETGEIRTLNDLREAEFSYTAKIGASYISQKEQTLERMTMMLPNIKDPVMAQIIELKLFMLMDGVNFEDVREYANKRLVMMGIKEPETDDEKEMMAAQAQQVEEPDAMMVAAMAEDKKAQAMLLEQQRKGIEMQLTAQNETAKTQIKGFEAETDRKDTLINAQKANADIENKNIDAFGKKLDNTQKLIDINSIRQWTDDQILQQIAVG